MWTQRAGADRPAPGGKRLLALLVGALAVFSVTSIATGWEEHRPVEITQQHGPSVARDGSTVADDVPQTLRSPGVTVVAMVLLVVVLTAMVLRRRRLLRGVLGPVPPCVPWCWRGPPRPA